MFWKKHLWFSSVPVAVLTVDGELIGVLLFIFRTSSSGLEAAGAVPTLVTGLGSRLMTGMAAVDAVGNGAARRLLRMVVVVELVDGCWERAVSGGETDFSGSGAEKKNKKKNTLVKCHSWDGLFPSTTLGTLVLTRCLQDFLDFADGSLLLFVKILHSYGIAQFWRWGLQKNKHKNITTQLY